jgi:hypothetical protein
VRYVVKDATSGFQAEVSYEVRDVCYKGLASENNKQE